MTWVLHIGDSAKVLRSIPDASIDSVATDPPAGISFMGKDWDGDKGGRDQWVAWLAGILVECRRVLKPGGYALIWALPRTSHWTATATEDAGFEIRDVVMHLFGQGFPKSLDLSKAVDAKLGKERPIIGRNPNARPIDGNGSGYSGATSHDPYITAPGSEEAARWHGWGTALKPAAEHWILARKPFPGTVAANVLEHGTGALNIEGCRIEGVPESPGSTPATANGNRQTHGAMVRSTYAAPSGRWPANVTLDEHAAAELDAQAGERRSGGLAAGTPRGKNQIYGKAPSGAAADVDIPASRGGASRFFYVAKASKADKTARGTVENPHPTVKPTALMRWLCRLITPPGGTVLDPFTGSGSTGVACAAEGFKFIGIERDEQFAEVARQRIGIAYDGYAKEAA